MCSFTRHTSFVNKKSSYNQLQFKPKMETCQTESSARENENKCI